MTEPGTHIKCAAERCCAACRRRAPRERLLRYVADEAGRLRVDPLQRLPGRGVYLCPDLACLRDACRRGSPAQGLRRRLVPLDVAKLQHMSSDALRRACTESTARGLADGRVRHSGEIVETKLRTRLQVLAEQARRLEGEEPARADHPGPA